MAAPLLTLEQEILGCLQSDVLTLDVVEFVLVRALELWSAPPDASRETLEREAARLRGEVARYTEAIGLAGASVPELVETLKARRRRLNEVEDHLQRLEAPRGPLLPAAVLPELRRQLTDWQGCSTRSRSRPGRSCGAS
jgi:hypothetical protein